MDEHGDMHGLEFDVLELEHVLDDPKVAEEACSLMTIYGFVILSSLEVEDLVEQIRLESIQLASSGSFKKNSKIYQYSDSPRIVEAWKHSEPVYRLACYNPIRDVSKLLFGGDVTVFSTINFLRSTHQPLHADSIHFGCEPRDGLGAVWFACEDILPNSGPLHVVPRSHHLPPITYESLGMAPARSMSESAEMYVEYESAIIEQVNSEGLTPIPLLLKSGQFVVWAADLIHGSPQAAEFGTTRNSMVLHFHCSSNARNFVPQFSDQGQGKYRLRKIVDIMDQRIEGALP